MQARVDTAHLTITAAFFAAIVLLVALTLIASHAKAAYPARARRRSTRRG